MKKITTPFLIVLSSILSSLIGLIFGFWLGDGTIIQIEKEVEKPILFSDMINVCELSQGDIEVYRTTENEIVVLCKEYPRIIFEKRFSNPT